MDAPTQKPYVENRPWGNFVEFSKNELSTVKILTILPGQAFSLQYHNHRDEFWHVLSGNGTIQIGEKEIPVTPGEDLFIPRETKHRITGGTEEVKVLEVSRGEFDEADIVRLEDKYGRTS